LNRKGKANSPEHNDKISQSRKGKKWYNNGTIEKFSLTSPGCAWKEGRLLAPSREGANNVNRTKVEYMGITYETLKDALQATGMNRYALLKNGAMFENNPRKKT
jgi:hypothetical protein